MQLELRFPVRALAAVIRLCPQDAECLGRFAPEQLEMRRYQRELGLEGCRSVLFGIKDEVRVDPAAVGALHQLAVEQPFQNRLDERRRRSERVRQLGRSDRLFVGEQQYVLRERIRASDQRKRLLVQSDRAGAA